jgi:Bacterial aa3 type cytochrome c oxidase subunit IV
MADATPEEIRAHMDTYSAFNKLVLFTILWVILLLASMALGLVAHAGIISLLLGVGGTIVLLIGFAVLG